MKRSTIVKTALGACGALTAAAAAAVYLTAPGRPAPSQKVPFLGRNIAHRGLHDRGEAAPENSLAAFAAAAAAGYGAELDVHLSADGQVVVFHDDTTDRVCGVPGRVEDKRWEELGQLRLCGTEERIPLLSQALEALGGQPVIIELKTGRHNAELCEKTLALMDSYKGPACIESFDPFIVRWFKNKAPDILRGQLTTSMEGFGDKLSGIRAFAMSRVLTNFLTRPHFIAHGIGKKSPAVRLSEALGAMKVAWTSHDRDSEADNDAVIFEYYRPPVRYK